MNNTSASAFVANFGNAVASAKVENTSASAKVGNAVASAKVGNAVASAYDVVRSSSSSSSVYDYLDDDLIQLQNGIAALSIEGTVPPTPIPKSKPLSLSPDFINTLDNLINNISFRLYIAMYPPSFPTREIPNDPFECNCSFCSTHNISVPPYGFISPNILHNAFSKRSLFCLRFIH
jgi:hypothetical protein